MRLNWIVRAALVSAIAVFVVGGLGSSCYAATAGGYSVTQLPTLGGAQDFANWINDRGWVAA